jgi:nucleotide sugar dehydrogenase
MSQLWLGEELQCTIPAMSKKPLIGFVGQGYVGKNYADDFESRGYAVVRYSLEEPYIANKDLIKDCDIVFIAVPTPSTPKGFDASIVEGALSLVGKGKIAVIKSTIVPGTTRRLQKRHPGIVVFFCPEFLSVATAAYDVANPFANIIGSPSTSVRHQKASERVLSVLKKASVWELCTSEEAELVKYAHNISGYMQILTFNLVYDLAEKHGADWGPIQRSIEGDPLVCNRYANPVHKGGRGAGGFCFIKDMAAFARHYGEVAKEPSGIALLKAAQEKNIKLLMRTRKDTELLEGVYGTKAVAVLKRKNKKR